jgi:hypothetical protein
MSTRTNRIENQERLVPTSQIDLLLKAWMVEKFASGWIWSDMEKRCHMGRYQRLSMTKFNGEDDRSQ